MPAKTLDDIYAALQAINNNLGSFQAQVHADALATQALLKQVADGENAVAENNGLSVGLGEDGKLSATAHIKF